MDKKKIYIILGIGLGVTAILGTAFYLIVRNNTFVPTPESVNEPIDIEIDISKSTQDTTEDVPPLPSQETNVDLTDSSDYKN
jgi:hypothetical protein